MYLKSELSNTQQFMLIPFCCYCSYCLCCFSYCSSAIKNKKITQQQQQHTDTSTEIVSYFLDHSSFYDDYSYVKLLLLLLKFMCSCTSTRTITGQQQHEMVTTTTHSDLHILLSVQELIFPIQQQNMNTSSEKLMLICSHHLIIGGVYLSTSSDKLT